MKKKYLKSSCLFILILMFLAVIFPAGTFAQSETKTTSATAEESVIGVSYRGHVQNFGNVPTPEGTMIAGPDALGTTGKCLRLEGFWIDLTGDVPANAGISYQVHVQNVGWQDAVNNGDFAGTKARGLRIEAIKISLVNLPDYDVYYRGHVQNVGNIPQIDGDWGWVKNGEELGTTGKGLRLEELQIKIVRKGIDLTAYNTLLDTIEKLDAANYSPESWATLQTALTDNKMTEANSQASIDAATQAIQAAYDALSLKVVAVYDKPGVYGPETGTQTIEGSVIIDVSGVTLQNLVIKGDLTVSEAVGNGDATLNNLTVEGTTVLAGGGTGGATLTGLATSGEMALAENSGGITIDGGDYNRVQISKKDNGGIQIIMKNNVTGNIEIIDAPEGQPIILKGQFKGIGIQAPDIKLDLLPGTTIGTIIAGSGNPYLISAAGLVVTGSGTVDNFTIHKPSSNVNVGDGINVGYATIDGGNATFNGAVGTAYITGKNAVFGSTVKSAVIFDNSNSFAVAPGSSLGMYPPNIVSKPTPPGGGGGGGPVLSSDASLKFTALTGTKLADEVMTNDTVAETGADEANAMPLSVTIAAENKASAVFVPKTNNATVTAYAGTQFGYGTYAQVAASYDFSTTNTTLWIKVVSEDGTNTKYYKAAVTVTQSSDASLDFTALTGTKLAGVLMTDDTVAETGADEANAMPLSVTIAAANKAAAVFVPETDNATVTGYADDGSGSGTYAQVAASYDFSTTNTTLWIKVVSEDGTNTKYYKAAVTVTQSSDASLDFTALTGTTLAGVLMTDDTVAETGADEANAMPLSVTIAAANKAAAVFVPETDNATVTGYADDGSGSGTYAQVAPSYDFSTTNTTLWIKVVSEDGTNTKYYKAAVTVV